MGVLYSIFFWLSWVTEEDRLSETAVWPTLFLLNVSTALKGTHNYIFIRNDCKFHIYTERQKSCTTVSFDFFLIKIDDFKNQCSLVFMPVQKTIVAEKIKCM